MHRRLARILPLVLATVAAPILGHATATSARETYRVPRAAAPETVLVFPPATPLLHLPAPAIVVPPPASGIPSLRPEHPSLGHLPFLGPTAPFAGASGPRPRPAR